MQKWEDSSLVSEHLMDAHAPFPEERVSLGGKWRFFCQRAEEPLPDGWELPDFPDKKWRRIPVPGSWEAEKLCQPEHLEGSGSQPEAGANLVGLYRRSFTLSQDQGSRQIILRFEAVSSCALVWVNGQYVGMAKGFFTPAEFDITSAVRPEKNMICVQVLRECDETCLAPKHTWRVAGILGDVSLYSLPARCITDLRASARWQPDGAPLLCVSLRARNADGFAARIALMDENGVIGYCESQISGDRAEAVISCKEVKRWTAETPNLYRVAVILWDGVAMYHTRQLSIGFREAALEGSRFLLNGQPEKLFAVDYHPFDPVTGCAPADEVIERELKTLRGHHFNAIRLTAPAPEALYPLCDRLGLYILDGSAPESESGPLQSAVKAHHARLAAAHASHPSLVAWNVNAGDSDILPLGQFRFLADPSAERLNRLLGRPVPPEKAGTSRSRKAAPVPAAEEPLGDLPVLLLFSDPASAPAEEAVAAIRESNQICGAVLGRCQDTVFLEKTFPGAPMGLIAPDGGLRPAIREMKALLQPVSLRFADGTLTAQNHSRFRSIGDYDCRYILTRDGLPVVTKAVVLEERADGLASAAIETQYDIFKPGRYHLNVELLDKQSGAVAAAGQWPVAQLKHIYDENPGGTIREDSGSILLRAQDASYVISRATGCLEQIRIKDREMLTEPAYPVYANVSSAGSGLLFADEWEKLTTRKKKPKPSVLEVDHLTRTVTASFHLGSGMMQTYRLHSDGSLALELRLRTGKNAPDRLGMRFALSKGPDQLRWFGLGPDDAAQGHTAGCFFGIHEQPIGPLTGKKEPVYNLTLWGRSETGLSVRSEEGLRAVVSLEGDSALLVLELPTEKLKPHTTYIFGFTIFPEN